MTRQVCDILNYRGKNREINTAPLQSFIDRHPIAEMLDRTCSLIWRGYYCKWKVHDQGLLLSHFHGLLIGGETASMIDLFPDARGPVLATWFSGEVVMPEGEVIGSGMYDTRWYDHVLTVHNGEIVEDALIENTPDRLQDELQRTIANLKARKPPASV